MFDPSCVVILCYKETRIPSCRPSFYLIPKVCVETKIVKKKIVYNDAKSQNDETMKKVLLFVVWKGNGDFEGSDS